MSLLVWGRGCGLPTGFDPVAVESFSLDEACIMPPSLAHRKVGALRGFGSEEDGKGVPVMVFAWEKTNGRAP